MGGPLKGSKMKVPPGKPRVSDSQESFVGGESKRAGTNVAPLDQCAAITNMRVVREGELAKRPGLRSVGSLASAQRLFASRINSGSAVAGTENIFGLDSAGAYSIGHFDNPLSSVPTFTVTTTGALGTAVTNGVTAADFRDATDQVSYIGVSSAHGLIKWAPLTGAITEGIASAKVTGLSHVWVYNQRLFGCKGRLPLASIGSVARTPTLYYSGLNNGDTMADTANGGGSATIRAYGAATNIVGGFALGGSMYILHEGAISVFRGTTFDDINIQAGAYGVAPNIGFPLAWQVIDQVAYIATSEGLFILTEGGGIRSAGTPEHPDPLAALLRSLPVDYTRLLLLGSEWFVLDNSRKDEVWIVANFYDVTNTVQASRLFIYHTKLGRFTGRGTFASPIAWAVNAMDTVGGGVNPHMLFVNGTTVLGCDFQFDSQQVYQDNGSSYTSSVQLRRMYTQAPADQKSWRSAFVQMGSGAGETAATNGSATGATLSYATSGATVADTTDLKAQQVNEIQLSGQGSHIDLTITDSGTSSTGWSVQRVEVEGFALGKRGG